MEKKKLVVDLFTVMYERYVDVNEPELFVGLRGDVIDVICVDGSKYVVVVHDAVEV